MRSFDLILVILCVLSTYSLKLGSEEFSQAELSALQDFYDSTDGPNWYIEEGNQRWNFSQENPNPCNGWYGIACTEDDFNVSHVYSFSLDAISMDGTLPGSMGTFTYLSDIFMSDNYLRGTIPKELAVLKQLELVVLAGNYYTGPFPDVLLNMPALTTLSLENNYFNGTLPVELILNPNIIYLDLGFNFFTGSIPLPPVLNINLKTLSLYSCLFSGNISDNIVFYPNLTSLKVHQNKLTGTIPSGIGKLTQLNTFSASMNNLTGTLPPEICQCTLLNELSLFGNDLHGSLPDDLPQMINLQLLNVGTNQITGSFPEGMQDMVLNQITVFNNRMTGWVPDDLGDVNNFQYFDLSYNYFSGTIPASLRNATEMTDCHLNNNNFHGTIPFDNSEYFYFYIHTLDLSYNHLTGSVPSAIGIELASLRLDHNQLEGTLPESLAATPRLGVFSVSNNHISGTIPSAFGNMRQALLLLFSDNLLSGTLPATFVNLESLQVLFLASNMLSGNLDHAFDSAVQQQLRYVDVSTNQFTGHLPVELFSCPYLKTFTALSNCFSGPLPVEMCGSSNLTSLVLDGLMSASSCQKRFFKNFQAVLSYGLSSGIPDGIPECLFSMPMLQTLHLSGNGLTGTLSSDLMVSPSLSVLSLSHNSLRGDIPRSVLDHAWDQLDLSYNKISGTLNDLHSRSETVITYENASLSLKVNRVSGHIPAGLKHLDSIQILDGNIFECDASRSSLPPSDPDYQIYSCGSNSFNDSIYLWCAVMGCIALIVVLWLLRMHSLSTVNCQWLECQLCMQVFSQSTSMHLQAFGDFASFVRKVFLWLTIVIVCILLPTYVALSVYYDTYTYEYAWSVSGVYLSGVTPAILLFLELLLFGVSAVVALYLYKVGQTPTTMDAYSTSAKSWTQSCILGGVVAWNMILVTGVNIAYVYIDHHYSSAVVQITQVFVALFKVTWNNFIVQYVLETQKHLKTKLSEVEEIQKTALESNVRPIDDTIVDSEEQPQPQAAGFVGLAVFVMLFNNIAAPFIATGYVSSNCFYDIVTTPADVTVSYHYAECTNFVSYGNFTSCFGYDNSFIGSASYPPPFLYSYQCASTFITTYANIFILMLTIDSFFIPLLLWSMKSVYDRVKESRRFPVVWNLLLRTLPIILMDLQSIDRVIKTRFEGLPLVLFRTDAFVVKLISVFAVLCTFGAILPPVAVICCVAAISITYQAQIQIGTFVTTAIGKSDLIKTLSRDCEGVANMFLSGVHIIVPFAAIFFGLVLFDTLGDAVGWQRALVVPLLICTLPILVYVTSLIGVDRWVSSVCGGRHARRVISKETGLQYSYISSPTYAPLSEHEETPGIDGSQSKGEIGTGDLRVTLL